MANETRLVEHKRQRGKGDIGGLGVDLGRAVAETAGTPVTVVIAIAGIRDNTGVDEFQPPCQPQQPVTHIIVSLLLLGEIAWIC